MFLFLKSLCMYGWVFLAMLGLSLVAGHRLLITVVFLVTEHKL